MSTGDEPREGEVPSAPGSAATSAVGAEADSQAAHRARLQHGQRLGELTLEQLWLRFFAVGGDAGLVELEAYLAGLMPLPARQRDLLAQAVNERLDELLSAARVPYSHGAPSTASARRSAPAPTPEPTGLVALLAGSSLAAPEQLPALAASAFRTLGLDVTVYLADHDQQVLVPVSAGQPAGGQRRQPVGIDATLPGRAFRQVRALDSATDGQYRLWLPLLDGAERLGVLEVQSSGTDRMDDSLREQCQHLAGLLGHLVTAVGTRGDALEVLRRTRPRTPSAELVWQLLPPPTAQTDTFSLSGWLEPADDVGGDMFDYALSSARVSLAVFDAMGHGLRAGGLAAAAVSAYRAARRNGEDLPAQASAIDAAVSAVSRGGSFVTGFLGELDLSTGRLAYLSAGHPHALLLRGGRVVRALKGSRRVPFGLDALDPSHCNGGPAGVDEAALGAEDLEPGDWLVVHTDGVTEARDVTGEFFGDARLADFVRRAAAAGQPPPETARRLAHAVLSHQHGVLQDDATVLLGCWQPR